MQLVSVIVPVYNVKEYLPYCIASIRNQTYANLEIIVVDDGSTDGSGTLCDELAAPDPRIRVIHQANGGLSAARNAGTAICHGDYITYVDSDDCLAPDFVKTLYDIIQKEGTDAAVCQYLAFCSDGDPFTNPDMTSSGNTDASSGEKFPVSSGSTKVLSGKEAVLDIVQYHKRFMIMASLKLYSRKFIDLLQYPVGKLHEDEFVTYKVFYHCKKVGVTDLKGYGYRIRKGSIMQSTYSPKRLDALEGLLSVIDFFESRSERELADRATLRYLLNLEITWYRVQKGMPEDSVKDSIKADLIARHKKLYAEKHSRLKPLCTFTEKMTIFIFRLSPMLYTKISDIYLKNNNDLSTD